MLRSIIKTGELTVWSMFKDYLRSKHTLTYLFWECTLRCNFRCKHCGSNALQHKYPDELSTADIKNTFRDIARDFDAGKIMVAVTGGEPLTRPDLFTVMKYAHSLGFPWGMVTNGSLVTEKTVSDMKRTGMTTVVISIDGMGRTHDAFRDAVGAYNSAVKAVKMLTSAHFLSDLQITTTVHRKALPELDKMYRTFLPLGITSWRLINPDPIGRAEINNEILLTGPELRRLLDFIKAKRKKSPIHITYGCAGFLGMEYEGEVRDRLFECNTGINTASILHTGDIFVCPNVPRIPALIQGNVRHDRFSEVWKTKFRQFRDKNRTRCPKCSGCQFWDFCLGGSFHLWNFSANEPKFCHTEVLKIR